MWACSWVWMWKMPGRASGYHMYLFARRVDLIPKHRHWQRKNQPKAASYSTVCVNCRSIPANDMRCSRKMISLLLQQSTLSMIKISILFTNDICFRIMWIVSETHYFLAIVYITAAHKSLFFFLLSPSRLQPSKTGIHTWLMAIIKVGLLLGFTDLWTVWFCFVQKVHFFCP